MVGILNEGTLVEYIRGEVFEDVKHPDLDENRYSFDWRSGHVKYCAIGIITKVEYHATCWQYLVRILWNNCKKEEGYYRIGANDYNLRKLRPEEAEHWTKFLNLKGD